MSDTRLVLVSLLIMAISLEPAHGASCPAMVSASGRAANPANYDPPQTYDAERLARSRAIEAWAQEVRNMCPGFSTSWLQAKRRNVLCEGYAGGLSCEAAAQPVRM